MLFLTRLENSSWSVIQPIPVFARKATKSLHGIVKNHYMAYANLFMHHLESQLLNLAPVKPYLWLWYIDDIFIIWTAGEQSLLEFLQWINQLHDNIKFTWDWSKRTINYLDVQIINNNGVIATDLYTRPTDKHQYLIPTTGHELARKRTSKLMPSQKQIPTRELFFL